MGTCIEALILWLAKNQIRQMLWEAIAIRRNLHERQNPIRTVDLSGGDPPPENWANLK